MTKPEIKLTSPTQLKRLLDRHGVSLNKRLGQNFLVDENHLRRICQLADLDPDRRVLEIGAGAGTLTRALAELAGAVWTIEYDRHLLPVLAETLHGLDNVHLVHGDALALDLETLVSGGGRAARVVANLPYYITSPLLFKLLAGWRTWDRIVVMVQREVAERIVAAPGGKDYGALSVAVGLAGQARLMAHVPANAFFPRPDVSSSVVLIDLYQCPEQAIDREIFFALVRSAFRQRRKTLGNSLSAAKELGLSKHQVNAMLMNAGVDPARRAETLTVAEFKAIAQVVKSFQA
ncbi:MAG: 16S rRNA (adenine(1518)-N(6)/adenine(1519)-N(6))-dimethyltransferase RsmA [Bacillota bacterium]